MRVAVVWVNVRKFLAAHIASAVSRPLIIGTPRKFLAARFASADSIGFGIALRNDVAGRAEGFYRAEGFERRPTGFHL